MEVSKRYMVMIIGLFINAVGINLITNATLGTSPITSVPYTLALKYSLSLGEFTFIVNLALIAFQLILLRRRFRAEHWLEIPLVFLLSAFIDITSYMFMWLSPENYALKIILLLIGCAVLGIGVALEFVANVAMLPGEGCVNAVCLVFNTDMGKTKVGFDVSMTVIAAVMSLIYFGGLISVREGTVISAVLVGIIARTIRPKLAFIDRFILSSRAEA
ncbi:MAG: YitT family protein [Clostridia bacterium]|nr:YitT family protein [Clostridia bacterium]